MIKPINHDTVFLRQTAVPATENDLSLGQDLSDTLNAHMDECVGIAANMIGINKSAIIAMIGPLPVVMFNPELISKQEPYSTNEGCLSLKGERTTTRYRKITVKFRNRQWKEQFLDLNGFSAQIVQHEIDHLHGILI